MNEETKWTDPKSGAAVDFGTIVDIIKSKPEASVHIGTDSHMSREVHGRHIFASVICIYEEGRGADYYFSRSVHVNVYHSLRQRIMAEVGCSVDVALMLMEHFDRNRIVVHTDVNSSPKHATFNMLSQVKSWVTSIGLKFRCKPNAWASSGVADRHAK